VWSHRGRLAMLWEQLGGSGYTVSSRFGNVLIVTSVMIFSRPKIESINPT
jgi:hypothetical protein